MGAQALAGTRALPPTTPSWRGLSCWGVEDRLPCTSLPPGPTQAVSSHWEPSPQGHVAQA